MQMRDVIKSYNALYDNNSAHFAMLVKLTHEKP